MTPGLSCPRGYVLVELLISAAVACALLTVILRLCVTAQESVRIHGNHADLQQRLRVAVETIRRDLLDAGGGLSNGVPGPLVDAFAPVVPARLGVRGADADLAYHSDRITIMYVPRDASQTRLRANMPALTGPLVVEGSAPGCPSGGVCGFRTGDRVLIFAPADGDGSHDVFTIGGVDAVQGLLTPAAPLSRTYGANSPVATVIQRVYYLDRAGRRLMVYDGDRSDVPVVDHVVDLRFTFYADPLPTGVTPPLDGAFNCAYAVGTPPVPLLQDLGGLSLVSLTASQLTDGPPCGAWPRRFDADLLRVRRVRVSLRLEAEGAEFRGPGAAFANPGTSVDARRYIPDLQLTFDVAPRNFLNTALR